ncbi:AAA family ATPase [Testudinibacter sp. P27/CKL/0425]
MTLAAQIKKIISDEGLVQAQVAKEVGVSSSILSQFLNGVYKGDNKSVESAVSNWLKSRSEKVKVFVEAPLFIETATAKQIFTTLEFARLLGSFALVYGASGVGKTRSAQEYKANNTNVWLVTASPSRSSLAEILYEMALELNINDAPRRAGRLARLVSKKLERTGGLMIIDEADHLPYAALEEIRILQEETGIGFVLIGNDKVYNRLRGGINQAHEFARLWSRVSKKTSIQKCKKADVTAIAKAWGLDIDDKDLMAVLNEIGGAAGGLRALTQYLRLAGISAKGNNTVINLDLILAAKHEMEGEK